MHDAGVETVWVFHQGLVTARQDKPFPGLRDEAQLRGRGSGAISSTGRIPSTS
jgi:hypothetical protein